MNIDHKLKQIRARYEELTNELSNPEIFNDGKRYGEVSKEHNDLKSIVEDYERFQTISSLLPSISDVIF